jgi:hypothetical protein
MKLRRMWGLLKKCPGNKIDFLKKTSLTLSASIPSQYKPANKEQQRWKPKAMHACG